MRTLLASVISILVATIASALAGLLSLPLIGALFTPATNHDGPNLFGLSLAMAYLGIPVALIGALTGVLILWLFVWLPAFCFRRQLSYFWRPSICGSIGAFLGVLLLLFLNLISGPMASRIPEFITIPEMVAAGVGGAVLFYLGFRFSTKSEAGPNSSSVLDQV